MIQRENHLLQHDASLHLPCPYRGVVVEARVFKLRDTTSPATVGFYTVLGELTSLPSNILASALSLFGLEPGIKNGFSRE